MSDDVKKSFFDLIDKGFDMVNEVLDGAEAIGKGIKYHTEDEPDEHPLKGAKDANPEGLGTLKSEDSIIDAEFTEVSTKVEVPHPIEHHTTAPTVPNRDILLGVTRPDFHNHLFPGLVLTSLCGMTFAAGDIVGRTTLDRTATHKSIVCIACLSIAIQGK